MELRWLLLLPLDDLLVVIHEFINDSVSRSGPGVAVCAAMHLASDGLATPRKPSNRHPRAIKKTMSPASSPDIRRPTA